MKISCGIRYLSVFLGGLLLAAVSRAAAVPDYTLKLMPGEPPAADTGYFLLWPNGFSATDVAVRVSADGGREVGSLVLWAAAGEPLKILFDCSSGASLYRVSVRAGQGEASVPSWTPAAGLVLETRERKEGAAGTWQELRALYFASKPVLGRSLMPDIFLGIHPHGPTRDFVSIFKGVFQVDQAGTYAFATMSENASCLLVNGTLVAEWLGRHGVHGGRGGQHGGRVQLKAGRHRIEYLNLTEGAGFTVAAAWKRPGDEQFEIMPAAVFPPVARFELGLPGKRDGLPPQMAWDNQEHFMVNDLAMVVMKFRVLERCPDSEYRWSFDDGFREQGTVVNHLFMSPGMRSARLERLAQGRVVAVAEQTVAVQPRWLQQKDCPQDIFRDQRRKFFSAAATRAPLNDLINAFRIGEAVGNLKLAGRAAALALNREQEFGPDQAQLLYDLAFFCQRPEVKEYVLAEKAFTALLELDTVAPRQRETARLHLAGMRLHLLDQVDAAQAALQEVEASALSESDRRMKAIYEGDLLLAHGRIDAARRAYLAAGTSASPDDIRYAIRRRARIESARNYLQRGEYESAERLIREIEWETPLERLNTETGLMRAQYHLGRREYTAAFACCRRLLKAAETDVRRPDLFFCLIEAAGAMGRSREAEDAYRQLLDDHPYSEAAARAKEQWGRKW